MNSSMEVPSGRAEATRALRRCLPFVTEVGDIPIIAAICLPEKPKRSKTAMRSSAAVRPGNEDFRRSVKRLQTSSRIFYSLPHSASDR